MARARLIEPHFMFSRSMRAVSRMTLPARAVVFRPDSGATLGSFGSESEMPSYDKALTSSRETSRAIREARESLGKNSQKPAPPGLSPDFPSNSRGGGFFDAWPALLNAPWDERVRGVC